MRQRYMKYWKWLVTLMVAVFIAGCGQEEEVVEEVPLDYEHITWQTDHVRAVSERSLEDCTFYVEHIREDGKKEYYPLGTPVSGGGNLYYVSGSEDIPTLFLGQGDRLVFHSYGTILSDIYFSRVKDLGYTIGIYNISSLENGRCYLGTGDSNILPVCTDSGFLERLEAESILIDEMGELLPSGYSFGEVEEEAKTCSIKDGEILFYDGMELAETRLLAGYDTSWFDEENPSLSDIRYPSLTADNLQSGILYGLKKDAKYHLEYYSGTYYGTSDMTANIHIYTPVEYYHTNQYSLLQGTLFEIELPEVCKDGIYTVGTSMTGNPAAFRLILGSEYSIQDDFNDFLFPEGLSGIYSESASHSYLQVSRAKRDATLIADPGDAMECYFRYTTGVGTSFYYKEGDVEYGRILEHHEGIFGCFQADEVQFGPGAVLIAMQDVRDGSCIVNVFQNETKFRLNSEQFDEILEAHGIPETEGVTINVFMGADLVFLKDGMIWFRPQPDMDGVLVLNAVQVLHLDSKEPLGGMKPSAAEGVDE